MKRGIILILILAFFVFAAPVAWASEGSVAIFTVGKSSYLLNGRTVTMDVAPYVKKGRTFLPLRFAANAVGVADENITWNPALRKITIIKGDRVVQFVIGSKVLTLNRTPVTMDVAPEIISGRVMLPIRWLAVALDVPVEWNPASRTVTIRVPGENGTTEAGPSTETSPPVTDDRQEEAPEKLAAGYIVKEYRWHDRQGAEWTWRVPVPEEMYRYYKSQPRIHERILKKYQERLDALRRQVEELRRYMDYWYQQYRILPGDSYYEALWKYQMYMQKYNEALRELEQILQEYQKLQWLYREAKYQQILDGYVSYVTEERNYELVKTLARVLAQKAPRDHRGRIEFAAAFVQEAIPYIEEEGEYPRYPVETLVDGGDCEDKSILLAAILRAMGYRVALLFFEGNPGHMAVGVECPNCWGTYYLKDGVRYFYLETTSPGWSIGEVPLEYQEIGALVSVVR